MLQQPFLKLPREVRDMIYINALVPTGHIVLVSNGSLTGPQRLNLRFCSKEADEQSFSKEPLCLNLSLICRQVRSEAEEIFWKNRLHIILGVEICWREQVHGLLKSFYFSFDMKKRLYTSSPDDLDECFDTDGDHPPPPRVFRRIHPSVERNCSSMSYPCL
ncbi:hypothetical protein ACEPPN_008505 [Leptodophora sp. 'Broadleaf-Isolate-01']